MYNDAVENLENRVPSEQAEPVVMVDHVSMVFNVANERISSLKEYAIKLARRELMFREFKALDDVSFTVNRGDVFGLIGTNGSGKSTMLKIVAGVLEPSSGTCKVSGTIAPLIELGAGFDMELSARENIYLNGALLGYPKRFIEEHFDRIVEFADVEGFLDMPMKNYSSGMVARIAFAIATEVIPDILIVDEALSVGDFMFQEKCERRIRSLIDNHGVTVLIVSHDSSLVERLCNKAIWIEKGVAKVSGDAEEVCSLYRLLGGHAGSEDSAAKVQAIFERQVEAPKGLVTTCYAENRFSLAAKLAEMARDRAPKDLILAPGDSEQVCFVANSLAGLLETSVLLYRKDSITDATLSFLLETRPERVIFFGMTGQQSNEITDAVKEELQCPIVSILGESFDEIALNAFNFGREEGLEWSDTVLLTHNASIADRVTLAAYTYKNKIPIFYHAEDAVIAQATIDAINAASCRDLLVVGGAISLPDECLGNIHVANEMHRFCYKDGYEAGIEISKWIMARDADFSLEMPILASALEIGNSMTVGRFAAERGSVILLEDPRNLDSVAAIFDYLNEHKDSISKLMFLGNPKTFSRGDRGLLEKALVL